MADPLNADVVEAWTDRTELPLNTLACVGLYVSLSSAARKAGHLKIKDYADLNAVDPGLVDAVLNDMPRLAGKPGPPTKTAVRLMNTLVSKLPAGWIEIHIEDAVGEAVALVERAREGEPVPSEKSTSANAQDEDPEKIGKLHVMTFVFGHLKNSYRAQGLLPSSDDIKTWPEGIANRMRREMQSAIDDINRRAEGFKDDPLCGTDESRLVAGMVAWARARGIEDVWA